MIDDKATHKSVEVFLKLTNHMAIFEKETDPHKDMGKIRAILNSDDDSLRPPSAPPS